MNIIKKVIMAVVVVIIGGTGYLAGFVIGGDHNVDELTELTPAYKDLESKYEDLESKYKDLESKYEGVCKGVYNLKNDEPYRFSIEYDGNHITYYADDNSGLIRDDGVISSKIK